MVQRNLRQVPVTAMHITRDLDRPGVQAEGAMHDRPPTSVASAR